MSTPILSVDEICVAVQTTLEAELPAALVALEREHLGEIKDWKQLPEIKALVTARVPAVAITSAGLVTAPVLRNSSGTYDTTWRIAIGIYERGRNHDETQKRVRDWCACIRLTLLSNPSLGGVSSNLIWSGEEFDLIPDRDSARTVAIGAVAVNVDAQMLAALPPTVGPDVESVESRVTVRPY